MEVRIPIALADNCITYARATINGAPNALVGLIALAELGWRTWCAGNTSINEAHEIADKRRGTMLVRRAQDNAQPDLSASVVVPLPEDSADTDEYSIVEDMHNIRRGTSSAYWNAVQLA